MSEHTDRYGEQTEFTETERQGRSPGEQEPADQRRRIRWIGLGIGVGVAVLIYFVLPADLGHAGRLTAATAALMAVWWMTEAIPIPATALVPLVIFPAFTEVKFDDVGASYGNNIIFLFMGGFLLALAMQRWNLHRRIALTTVRLMGTRPPMVVAGFMLATGFLSMWVSNTATAVMMLPIGVSVLMLATGLARRVDRGAGREESQGSSAVEDPDPTSPAVKEEVVRSNFGTALMLGIAYAASIGSLATIIGTPPNAFLVGFLSSNYDIQIGFGQWMLVGLPIALIMLVVTWLLLTKVLFRPEISEIPGGRELMSEELRKLGPMASGEKRVLAIFVLAVIAWVALPLLFDSPPLSDAGIAMAVGVLLFILPAGAAKGVRLLDWHSAVQLPWGVLLLFGGGLALSSQFTDSGLTAWVGERAQGLGFLPTIALVAVLVAGVIFLTELTSNTATAASVLPLVAGLAIGLDQPLLMLTVLVALAATCAFMLPVATPPNAIAYGSGYVTVGQMVKGGLWLNVIGIVVITLLGMALIPLAFLGG
ncbi:SLC13 family permease [Naumannella huperziae]